jgi:Asp-tRNA(Asn)/Glu-tRNA(Gln) amidotransferase A subunit family amidase
MLDISLQDSYGAVSIEGVRPLDPRVDTIGLLARSITDIELVAKVLGVFRCQTTPTPRTDLKGAKFGFFMTDVFDQYASKGLKSVWERAKRSLVEAGAIMEEIELGEEFDGWEGTGGRYDKIVYTAGGISCDMEYKLGQNQVSDTVIERAEYGIDRQEMVKIWDELAALRPKFDKIARKYDGIITPSSLVEAPTRDEDDVPDFCTLWTGLHAPTINIPGFGGVNGLPIGLTMVGARYVFVRAWS